MKYAWMDKICGQYPIDVLCRVVQVSRSGYYGWRNRTESRRSRKNSELVAKIRELRKTNKHFGVYGSPRMHAELLWHGYRCSENRVARLMRFHGIRAIHRRRFRVTTDSSHDHPVAENLLNRRFEAAVSDRVWMSDISYVWTREGWLYLAVVIDLCTRLVVGWSMGESITRELTLSALRMALWRRNPGRGLLHHSDRGSQYACSAYRKLLDEHGIVCSMSRKGDCWDNAVVESFFHTLKAEHVHHQNYATRYEAKADIFEWLEVFYNRQRRHSSLGYMTPAGYDAITAKMA